MIALYYEILFACSVLLAVIYVFLWHKHFDTTFTLVFTLIPIDCLGYVMYANAKNIEEAVLANKIIYIGGSFLPYFIMLSILNLCEIKISKWLIRGMFVCCMILYGSVLTIGYAPYFYKEISFTVQNGTPQLIRSYGIMHMLILIMIVICFTVSLAAIIFSYFKKNQVSRKIIYLLFLPDLLSMLSYFVGRRITNRFDCIPAAFIFAEIMYLLIAYRVSLYDISDTAIDTMVQNGETGFITFDSKLRYLGSNETAKAVMPELKELYVDRKINRDNAAGNQLFSWLSSFIEDSRQHEFFYTVSAKADDSQTDDRIFRVEAGNLYGGKHRSGYMITMTDDTQNRKYIRLLDHYNEDLQRTVEEKTRHITEMHDNLIMSMAVMVESRDNSTGGHINRTSVCVRILIDEIRKSGELSLNEEFCKDIIKAAPMHDLGKIAVDDAVLRKPGRFTDEEFEKMKHHAAEGARVIHEILKKTDDDMFHIIAENVAHYHHERWDGSGYPDGLQGEAIPVEARIMAIADVYDALVSKRVYKDSMSFEKADSIILSGMGTQFDPQLEPYYRSARPRLEQYYESLKRTEES